MKNTNGLSEGAIRSSRERIDYFAREVTTNDGRLTADELIQRYAHIFGEIAWRSITIDNTIHEVSKEHLRLVTELLDEHWDFEQGAPRSFLEVGAYAHTTGYSLVEKYGAEVTLFEISDRLLEEGRKLAGYAMETDNPRRVAGDFHDLPFENESFDVVLISSSLHHSWEWEKVLGEMQRVLAPGGLLFLENEPCRRECCFYGFRGNRPESFTAFEKTIDDLGVLRTFSEPALGSRPEKLFGIVENMEIPLGKLVSQVKSEARIVDMSLIPEHSMTEVDHSWVEQADLGPHLLAEVIEKKLTEAHKAAWPYLDRATRAQGFGLPALEEIGPFAWRIAVRLCALPPKSSEHYPMMISDTFGGAVRIVARKHGERKRSTTAVFRRAVEEKNGVFYGFREDVSRFFMERHSWLPDIQSAEQAELDTAFPPAQWSRLDLDNGFTVLKLIDQPGAIRVPPSTVGGVLILRCDGGVEPGRSVRMRVEQGDREIYSINLWKSESFLCVAKLDPRNDELNGKIHVHYEIEDENGSFIPANGHMNLGVSVLVQVGELLNPVPATDAGGTTDDSMVIAGASSLD